jgi:hypothetical protein
MARDVRACHCVRRHKTIRKHDKISFKGYGRGAAAMTPLDAARLVIAVAGSTFAKDSMASLNRFCDLLSDKDRRRPRGSRRKLENFLAERILRIVSDEHYRHLETLAHDPPRYNLAAHVALKLMWVAGEDIDALPRVAVVRWFRSDGGADAMSFAPEDQTPAILDDAQFVRHYRNAGLIQGRVVAARALAKIALSLFGQST